MPRLPHLPWLTPKSPCTEIGSAMYDTIKNFPNQFETSLHIVEETDFRRLSGFQFRQLYYAGMGGSCLGADLFNHLYSN